MPISLPRRTFLALSLSTAAGLALVPQRAFAMRRDDKPASGKAARFFDWQQVSDSVPNVHAAFGNGGNSMVIVGKRESLLVDAKNTIYGPQLRREAEAFGQPLKHLVSSHHHGDHTGGNHAFLNPALSMKAEDAAKAPKAITVVSHANAAKRVEGQVNAYLGQIKSSITELGEMKNAKKDDAAALALVSAVTEDANALHKHMADMKGSDFAPTVTFAEKKELDVGGVRVILRHFKPGHTDNDIVIHLPEQNIIHTGDLLFRKVYPYIDGKAGGSTLGWQESLRELSKLCDGKTRIVPGHGALCDKAALDEQIKYFDDMRAWVTEQVKAGKTRKEVAESNPAPYDGYNVPWIRPITLGGIYDEVVAAKK